MRVITKPSNALKTHNDTKQFPDPRYALIFIVSTVLKLLLSILCMYNQQSAHTLCAPTLRPSEPYQSRLATVVSFPGPYLSIAGPRLEKRRFWLPSPVPHSDNKQKLAILQRVCAPNCWVISPTKVLWDTGLSNQARPAGHWALRILLSLPL